MINIGITGQAGFIGTHLYNELNLYPEEFNTIFFKDEYFDDFHILSQWVKKCDIIVHFAAMNRHNDPDILYKTNIGLVNKLIDSMKVSKSKAHIIFSSSTQESRDNAYGKSKREGRELLYSFASENNSLFSGLVIPNVFGPFGNPYYNSFVATFSHQLVNFEQPSIQVDSAIKLIYVGNLCKFIISRIRKCREGMVSMSEESIVVPYDFENKVSEILNLLTLYKNQFLEKSIVPFLKNVDEINLFNTFCSYIEHEKLYPIKLVKHLDNRGFFVEMIRLGIGGQVSFSMTVPGIVRGNHYHTRKIERFIVIKGNAIIQLRKIGTKKVLSFELSGNEPSFVDIPIWYTHSIKNIGTEELCTIFWINELFNPEDTDTYFEIV